MRLTTSPQKTIYIMEHNAQGRRDNLGKKLRIGVGQTMVAKKNSEGNLDGRSEKAQTGMTGRCIE
jgi:hypothetical protein